MPANDFKAWIDTMPGHHDLHVVGKVQVPTGGWTGSLIEKVPQGINPAILILDVKLVKPDGMATDVISFIEVRYDKTRTSDYTNVTIFGDGPEFTIPVSRTS